jgi:hypothetical protein
MEKQMVKQLNGYAIPSSAVFILFYGSLPLAVSSSNTLVIVALVTLGDSFHLIYKLTCT